MQKMQSKSKKNLKLHIKKKTKKKGEWNKI